jgi:hypothetical protein
MYETAKIRRKAAFDSTDLRKGQLQELSFKF